MKVKIWGVFGVLILIATVMYFQLSKKTETPDGGPCTYTITMHSANVIAIHPIDSIRYDVLFEVKLQGKTDTLSKRFKFDRFTYSSQVKKDNKDFNGLFEFTF